MQFTNGAAAVLSLTQGCAPDRQTPAPQVSCCQARSLPPVATGPFFFSVTANRATLRV